MECVYWIPSGAIVPPGEKDFEGSLRVERKEFERNLRGIKERGREERVYGHASGRSGRGENRKKKREKKRLGSTRT